MDKRHIIVTIIVAELLAIALCDIKANEKPSVVSRALDGFSGAADNSTSWVADPNDSDRWERRYYSSLSLRAKYSNGRFVTYQMATNENHNGVHGYYTLQMITDLRLNLIITFYHG